MKWKLGLVVCSALVVSAASGGNTVRVWYASDPNGYLNAFNRVQITAPGTYMIDAITTPGKGTGFVDKIWIDDQGPVVNGDVFVYVLESNTVDGIGVTELKEVNLTHVASGYQGSLVRARCRSHLGALGPIRATNVTDGLYVGGNVLNAIDMTGDLATISITGLLKADLSCNSMNNLTITGIGTPPGTPPNITVGSPYAHQMTVHQTLNTLTLAGVDPNGHIQITGSSDLYHLAMPSSSGVIDGTVSVQGNLRSAFFEGVGEGGSLSAGSLVATDPNDIFHLAGDVAGVRSTVGQSIRTRG